MVSPIMVDVTNLLLEMLERISLVAVSGYLLTQTAWCRRILNYKMGITGNILTIALFSSMEV